MSATRNIVSLVCRKIMTTMPPEELILVPGGTLITATPEDGRALALAMARLTIHNIQPDLARLKESRPEYSRGPRQLDRRCTGGRARISNYCRRQRLLAQLAPVGV